MGAHRNKEVNEEKQKITIGILVFAILASFSPASAADTTVTYGDWYESIAGLSCESTFWRKRSV